MLQPLLPAVGGHHGRRSSAVVDKMESGLSEYWMLRIWEAKDSFVDNYKNDDSSLKRGANHAMNVIEK